ncbi:FdrA family protein [Nonomuraea sp. ATR24]|uniref:FdrA family protein n=1 Tax=Nonomuraea sp. ATR24 TaxID=1676744 RepID=UPI0035BED2D2
MGDAVFVRRGVYHDSVTLMRAGTGLPGAEVAVVAMATQLNLGLARDLGFDVPAADPGDLLVALRGDDVAGAAEELDRRLTERAPPGREAEQPPRTTRSAARSPADLVLVSVPGEHAFAEALDAVEAGLPVMIFSDGVPVEQERLLKERADERGVLVMGPDCGTAVIGGVGLGFANVLRPGPVGVVAASGTGAQQVTCLLDLAGVGVSHVLGVGGRDLSAEIGGRSTVRALRMLDDDPATELIVLISKPPSPEVAAAVREVAGALRTPVVTAVLGGDADLTSAAEEALRALGVPVPDWPSWTALGDVADSSGDGIGDGTGGERALVGVYSGGTLCAEAAAVAGRGEFTDYGDDVYTRARAHPMIDPTLRLEALRKVPPDAVVLMDVVLGHGADPDPAAALAPAIAASPATVVVALVGTEGDPQGLRRQAETLRAAGAAVFASNARAARFAATTASRPPSPAPASGPGPGPGPGAPRAAAPGPGSGPGVLGAAAPVLRAPGATRLDAGPGPGEPGAAAHGPGSGPGSGSAPGGVWPGSVTEVS